MKLRIRRCYPKGNFGRNQLLGGSMSLSPLYPDLTINLHVRIASSLHQGFPWLHPIREKFTTFRVAAYMLILKSFAEAHNWSMVPPCGFPPHLVSLRSRVYHPKTRTYVALLGPCFKTGWLATFRQRFRVRIISDVCTQVLMSSAKSSHEDSIIYSSPKLVLHPKHTLTGLPHSSACRNAR